MGDEGQQTQGQEGSIAAFRNFHHDSAELSLTDPSGFVIAAAAMNSRHVFDCSEECQK